MSARLSVSGLITLFEWNTKKKKSWRMDRNWVYSKLYSILGQVLGSENVKVFDLANTTFSGGKV